MKIAVTCENPNIIDTDGKGHGALADFLVNLGVKVLNFKCKT